MPRATLAPRPPATSVTPAGEPASVANGSPADRRAEAGDAAGAQTGTITSRFLRRVFDITLSLPLSRWSSAYIRMKEQNCEEHDASSTRDMESNVESASPDADAPADEKKNGESLESNNLPRMQELIQQVLKANRELVTMSSQFGEAEQLDRIKRAANIAWLLGLTDLTKGISDDYMLYALYHFETEADPVQFVQQLKGESDPNSLWRSKVQTDVKVEFKTDEELQRAAGSAGSLSYYELKGALDDMGPAICTHTDFEWYGARYCWTKACNQSPIEAPSESSQCDDRTQRSDQILHDVSEAIGLDSHEQLYKPLLLSPTFAKYSKCPIGSQLRACFAIKLQDAKKSDWFDVACGDEKTPPKVTWKAHRDAAGEVAVADELSRFFKSVTEEANSKSRVNWAGYSYSEPIFDEPPYVHDYETLASYTESYPAKTEDPRDKKKGSKAQTRHARDSVERPPSASRWSILKRLRSDGHLTAKEWVVIFVVKFHPPTQVRDSRRAPSLEHWRPITRSIEKALTGRNEEPGYLLKEHQAGCPYVEDKDTGLRCLQDGCQRSVPLAFKVHFMAPSAHFHCGRENAVSAPIDHGWASVVRTKCTCKRGVFFFSPASKGVQIEHSSCFKFLLDSFNEFEKCETQKLETSTKKTKGYALNTCLKITANLFMLVSCLLVYFQVVILPEAFAYNWLHQHSNPNGLHHEFIAVLALWSCCLFLMVLGAFFRMRRFLRYLLFAIWISTWLPIFYGMPSCWWPPFGLSMTDVGVVLTVTLITIGIVTLGWLGVLFVDPLMHVVPAHLAYSSLCLGEKMSLRPLWGRLSLPSRWALHLDNEEGRQGLTLRAVEVYDLLVKSSSRTSAGNHFPWRSILALLMVDIVALILLDDYPLAQIMAGFVSVVVMLIIPIPYAFRSLAKWGCVEMSSLEQHTWQMIEFFRKLVASAFGKQWALYLKHLLRLVLRFHPEDVIIPFLVASLYASIREIAMPIIAGTLATTWKCTESQKNALDVWLDTLFNKSSSGTDRASLNVEAAFVNIQSFVEQEARAWQGRQGPSGNVGNMTGFTCAGPQLFLDEDVRFGAKVLMAAIQWITLTNTMTIIGLYIVALKRHLIISQAFTGLSNMVKMWWALPLSGGGFFLSPPEADKIFLQKRWLHQDLQLGNFFIPLEDPASVVGWSSLRKYLLLIIRKDMMIASVLIAPLFMYVFFTLVSVLVAVLVAFFATRIPGETWYSSLVCPTEANLIAGLDLLVQLLYMTAIALLDIMIRGQFHQHEQSVPQLIWKLKRQVNVVPRATAKREELESAIRTLEIVDAQFEYERLPPNPIVRLAVAISPALSAAARMRTK